MSTRIPVAQYKRLQRIHDRTLVALQAAEAERDRLRKAGEELASVLNDTLYQPPGYAGPGFWWDDIARAVLAKWSAALVHQADFDHRAVVEAERDRLRAVAEAAKEAVVLEYDPTRTDEQNAEIARRAVVLRAALAALEEK